MAKRKENWVPDKEAKECAICSKKFTPLRRKHHCRRCGGVFCAQCSSKKIKLADPELVRVCDDCFAEIRGERLGRAGKRLSIGVEGSSEDKQSKEALLLSGGREDGKEEGPDSGRRPSVSSSSEGLDWWYVTIKDKEKGPVKRDKIKKAWKKKEVDRNCVVWNKNMKDWAKISECPELLTYLTTASDGKPPPLPDGPVAGSPTSAGGSPGGGVAAGSTGSSMSSLFGRKATKPGTADVPLGATDARSGLIATGPVSEDYQDMKSNGLCVCGGDDEQTGTCMKQLAIGGAYLVATSLLCVLFGLIDSWIDPVLIMTGIWNFIAFVVYWIDSSLEFRGSTTRITDATLLMLLWWCGFAGAWAAMFLFRHKYRATGFAVRAVMLTGLNLFWPTVYLMINDPAATDDDGGDDDGD